jgi:hypothetical protein
MRNLIAAFAVVLALGSSALADCKDEVAAVFRKQHALPGILSFPKIPSAGDLAHAAFPVMRETFPVSSRKFPV